MSRWSLVAAAAVSCTVLCAGACSGDEPDAVLPADDASTSSSEDASVAPDPFLDPIAFDDAALAALDPTQLLAAQEPCRAPVRVRVDRAIDGDTVSVTRVNGGATERVRMIGVNTPEIAHAPGESDQCFGPEALFFTRTLVGHEAWLTFDRLCVDPYERTLAFVHVGPGPAGLWERQLVRRGLGRAYIIGRNDALEADIQADQREARAADRGLWGACP